MRPRFPFSSRSILASVARACSFFFHDTRPLIADPAMAGGNSAPVNETGAPSHFAVKQAVPGSRPTDGAHDASYLNRSTERTGRPLPKHELRCEVDYWRSVGPRGTIMGSVSDMIRQQLEARRRFASTEEGWCRFLQYLEERSWSDITGTGRRAEMEDLLERLEGAIDDPEANGDDGLALELENLGKCPDVIEAFHRFAEHERLILA